MTITSDKKSNKIIRFPWSASEILQDVKNKYISHFFFSFDPLYKEKIESKEESSLVNSLISSSVLKKDLLGESNENKNGLATFDMIESQITSNFYGNDYPNERLEYFSNDKYILVDFRTSLKTKSIKKLFQFFNNIEEESGDVLSGYITGVLTKIHEVSGDLLPIFLNKNTELISSISKNIDNSSISQFIVSLIVDNPWIKETDSSIKKAFCSAGTFEMAYSSVFTCKSRNDLFSESSDSIFDEKMLDWKEKLEKKDLLFIHDVILEELKQLPQNLAAIKNCSLNLFKHIMENFQKNQITSLNAVGIVYQIICKLIDLLIEHSNHDFPSYMNRFDKEDEKFISIWDVNKEEYFVGLFNNSEAKVSYDMFSKLMKELFNETVYSNKLKNIGDFLNATVFSNSFLKKYLDLFLEESNKIKSGNRANISSLDYLSRVIIIALHFETFNKSTEQHTIQMIIDNFSIFLELLEMNDNSRQIVLEGINEKPKLGSFRHFILKIFIHCFLVNNKNFNLFVSTSDLKKILLNLLNDFSDNDKFMHSFRQIIESILNTGHNTLLNSILSSHEKAKILQIMTANPKSNKFIILKILKQFDDKFFDEIKQISTQTSENQQMCALSTNDNDLDEMKKIIYNNFNSEIKCYNNLEKERSDRHRRKNTDSSIFSNNMLDDSDKFDNNPLQNLIDSDPPKNDFHVDLEDDNSESLDDLDENEEPIRRRKLSEDNIRLTENGIRESHNKKNNLK